jgi:hypothetical protein
VSVPVSFLYGQKAKEASLEESDLEALEIEGKLESLLRACLAEPPSPSAPVPVKVNKKIDIKIIVRIIIHSFFIF